jgi:peptidyl-prolyl cis-trans isomerase D
MLRFFRGFAKSWFGPTMGVVLVAGFAIFGGNSVRGVLNGRLANAVVSAGSHSVGEAQFRQILQNYEQAYMRQTGQAFSPQDAVKEGFDQRILSQLAGQAAYAEMLDRAGVRPPSEVIARELKREAESGKNPGVAQVFDSVTGRFRPDALQMLLQQNGLTLPQFESGLTDDIASTDFASAMGAGFVLPAIYVAPEAALLLQTRDATYFVIPESAVPRPPAPSDAQLNALIQQNKSQLLLPERRTLTVVRFSAKALAPTLTVTPAAIEQQFEAKKASYGKPELLSFVEIPLNNPKDAPSVEAALKAGKDPDAVARSVGVAAIKYADQPQSAIDDRKAAAAAFAMQSGQVSGSVQGDFRTVVLKVDKVTPAQPPSLDAARSQIEADLRQSQAVDKVYDLSQKFEDLRQGGASFDDAAKKLGLTPVAVGPIGQDGRELGGAPPGVADQRVLVTAFQLQPGADSDVEQDTDKGEYFAVQVDKVTPPSLPKLDEPGVRELLTRAYLQQTIVAALQKKAQDAQAVIQKNGSFADAAAPYHATISHEAGMQEATAQQLQQKFGRDLVATAFGAKAGQVFFVGSDPLKGMMVVRLDAVHAPSPQQIASAIPAVRPRLSGDYLEGLKDAIQDAAGKQVKPTTNVALARSAMGVEGGGATAPGK